MKVQKEMGYTSIQFLIIVTSVFNVAVLKKLKQLIKHDYAMNVIFLEKQ